MTDTLNLVTKNLSEQIEAAKERIISKFDERLATPDYAKYPWIWGLIRAAEDALEELQQREILDNEDAKTLFMHLWACRAANGTMWIDQPDVAKLHAAFNSPKREDGDVLPYDVKIGAVKFGKGVKLETFINAAKRWHEDYQKLLFKDIDVENLKGNLRPPEDFTKNRSTNTGE